MNALLNVAAALDAEIARVAHLRETYKGCASLPQVNVGPVLHMIEAALAAARRARADRAALAMVRALDGLRGFTA